MLLGLHISAALAGIITSSLAFLWPSANKIRLTTGMVALTVLSGTVIVAQRHLGLVSACISGLLYIGFTSVSLLLAARRLSTQKSS
jgi:hypothetical protein